jgi:hypothetical protein
MCRLLILSLVAALGGFSSGCAMCCAPHDCDYISVSGRWARHNPTSGRVGSAFDEAGGPVDAIQVSATDEPTPAQPSATQGGNMQPGNMQPGNIQPPTGNPMYRSTPNMAQPPSRMVPGTRSVIPRNMGETYLPRGQ